MLATTLKRIISLRASIKELESDLHCKVGSERESAVMDMWAQLCSLECYYDCIVEKIGHWEVINLL